jgi:hypothetical protein
MCLLGDFQSANTGNLMNNMMFGYARIATIAAIPNPSPDWDAAANLFRLAHSAESDASRLALLGEFALRSTAAYGVESPTLCSWWTSRLEPKKRGRRA